MISREYVLKTSKDFADDILLGRKMFEIRENDRGYQAGDHIGFQVLDEYGLTLPHPIIRKGYMITYVLSGYGLKYGYVAFGFEEVETNE